MLIWINNKFSKVSIKDKNLWKSYGTVIAAFSSIVTLFSFCVPPLSDLKWKIGSSAIFILFLAILFVLYWYRANQMKEVHLKINGTKVSIGSGDLFAKEGIKVIGVNNYIDLVADDEVVSKTTLHGQFVIRNLDHLNDIKEAIAKSKTLTIDADSQRPGSNSYDYGSCVLYEDYVLTVLTKFNKLNKAYTSIQEYIGFWMTFWDNIDAVYNSRTINIPIMGAGQTRFRGIKPQKQELLEIALWTLKKSGFCNNYSDKYINFVIYEGDMPEIDLYRIQKMFI